MWWHKRATTGVHTSRPPSAPSTTRFHVLECALGVPQGPRANRDSVSESSAITPSLCHRSHIPSISRHRICMRPAPGTRPSLVLVAAAAAVSYWMLLGGLLLSNAARRTAAFVVPVRCVACVLCLQSIHPSITAFLLTPPAIAAAPRTSVHRRRCTAPGQPREQEARRAQNVGSSRPRH